jgi:hypothetical protein
MVAELDLDLRGLRWVTVGSGLLCEEATGVGSVPFGIFCYGLLYDLRFVFVRKIVKSE